MAGAAEARAPYQLREPCGVAIHGDFVYVADTWNGRVQMFTLAGEWKAAAAGLFGPRAVAVAPDGTVWASDTGNQSIVSWDASLSAKKTLGKAGAGPGDFSGPVGIAASSSAIYVADVGNHRIQVLAPSGQFRAAWPFPGWKEWGEAHLETDGDRVYAADPGGNAVLAFDTAGRFSSAGRPATPGGRSRGRRAWRSTRRRTGSMSSTRGTTPSPGSTCPGRTAFLAGC